DSSVRLAHKPGRRHRSEFRQKGQLVLTLRPPKLSRRSPEQCTEMTGQMTLVRKADRVRNFRQWEIRLSQHLLGSFDSFLDEVVVRGDTGGLLKFSRKMM